MTQVRRDLRPFSRVMSSSLFALSQISVEMPRAILAPCVSRTLSTETFRSIKGLSFPGKRSRELSSLFRREGDRRKKKYLAAISSRAERKYIHCRSQYIAYDLLREEE